MSQEQIPKGWKEESLENLIELVMGQAPPGDSYNQKSIGTTFVKVSEFGEIFPEKKVWTTKPLKLAKTGDVLLCVVGSTGKLNLGIDCAIGRSICALRPDTSKILQKYLYYFLMIKISRIKSLQQGSVIGVITKKDIHKIKIPLSPLQTQKKIVQKLDDILGQLEEKRTQISQIIKPENIQLLTEQMRQEILRFAFSGKLTKREPNDEPVEKLLERIKSNRKENNKTENHLLEEINSSDTKIPQHWKYVKIHEVCDGVVPGRYKPQKFDGNIPWITLPDITSLYVSKSKQNRNLSEEETKKVNMKIFPPKTVLMSCVGEVGRICITKCKVVPNQQLHGFISYDKIVPEYIAYALMSIIDQIRKKATKTTMPYLNKTKCNNLIICLTSIEEEERIVNKINEKFGAIDLIHNKLKSVTESYGKLNNSLNLEKNLVLNAAFSGKLVN